MEEQNNTVFKFWRDGVIISEEESAIVRLDPNIPDMVEGIIEIKDLFVNNDKDIEQQIKSADTVRFVTEEGVAFEAKVDSIELEDIHEEDEDGTVYNKRATIKFLKDE